MKHVFGPFQSKTLDDYIPLGEDQEMAVKVIGDYIIHLDSAREQGRGVTLLGPNGVGKTMLASIVLNAAVGQGYRIESIELASYVGLHKDRFSLQSMMKSNGEEIVDHYIALRQHIRSIQGISKRSADWVLFDDVGREYPSESGWSQSEFFDTLRTRWNRGLPSLLTSNLPMADLASRYTEGLASLLMEATAVVQVDGEDYRWKKAN